jgi:hypothetical protein
MSCRSSVSLACLLSGLVSPGAFPGEMPRTDDSFCISVQQVFAATKIEARNTVYTDYQAFRKSKTVARPLQIHQFVLRDAAGIPQRVSCKVKTPDHLLAEYGPDSAHDRGVTCRDINRETAKRVYASLADGTTSPIHVPQENLVFDADETTFMGASWVGPYDYVYETTDGRLHVKAKALRVDWDNVWLSWAPDRLRGAYYCHLIAPEHMRRLALGEVTAPRAEP